MNHLSEFMFVEHDIQLKELSYKRTDLLTVETFGDLNSVHGTNLKAMDEVQKRTDSTLMLKYTLRSSAVNTLLHSYLSFRVGT